MAFSNARKTALQATATAGRVPTFTAKTAAAVVLLTLQFTNETLIKPRFSSETLTKPGFSSETLTKPSFSGESLVGGDG